MGPGDEKEETGKDHAKKMKKGGYGGRRKGKIGMRIGSKVSSKRPKALKRGGYGGPGTTRVPSKTERDRERKIREAQGPDIDHTKTDGKTTKTLYKGRGGGYDPKKLKGKGY